MSSSKDEIRIPPQDVEAEKSVLGCVFLDNDRMDEISGIIKPHMFHFAGNGKIFAVCTEQYERRQGFDVVTIGKLLDASGVLSDVGGVGYLSEILNTVPHAAHAKFYAEAVRDAWMRRRVIYGAADAVAAAHDMTLDVSEVIGRAEAGLAEVAEAQAGQGMTTVQDVLFEVLDSLAAGADRRGIETGYIDLDELIYGMAPGNLVIVAGRPAMGKTAFALNVAKNVCKRGQSVLIASMEMNKLELANRMLSIAGGIKASVMRGTPNEIECQQICEQAQEMGEWKLGIDDGTGLTVQKIAAAGRVHKRRYGLDLLVIDYLQLIIPEDKRINREQQVATMTRELKNVARSLNVPIMLLAQLNREVTKRIDKRPTMADLRESGGIENDADLIMMCHRPEYYDPKEHPGLAELIVAKQRNGKTGIVKLTWDGSRMRFLNGAASAAFVSHGF